MQLELTSDEARVLAVLTEYVAERPDVGDRIFMGNQADISIFQSIAGKLRGLHKNEERGSGIWISDKPDTP